MWSVLRVNLSNPVSSVGNESFTACKNTLHLCVCGAGWKILLSSRLGARVESSVNMNEQAHDNMSASHGRCENGKENEKRKWQGSSISK